MRRTGWRDVAARRAVVAALGPGANPSAKALHRWQPLSIVRLCGPR